LKTILILDIKKCTFDDSDFYKIKDHRWMLKKHRNTFYAITDIKGKRTYMHRLIFGSKKGKIIDHIDRNGLNNCKKNLRFCTSAQNSYNRIGIKNTSSKYKGVTWDKKRLLWLSRIGFKYKTIFIGRFKKEKDAAIAYDKAAKKYFGKFCKTNL